jgi:hypothetical protein
LVQFGTVFACYTHAIPSNLLSELVGWDSSVGELTDCNYASALDRRMAMNLYIYSGMIWIEIPTTALSTTSAHSYSSLLANYSSTTHTSLFHFTLHTSQ